MLLASSFHSHPLCECTFRYTFPKCARRKLLKSLNYHYFAGLTISRINACTRRWLHWTIYCVRWKIMSVLLIVGLNREKAHEAIIWARKKPMNLLCKWEIVFFMSTFFLLPHVSLFKYANERKSSHTLSGDNNWVNIQMMRVRPKTAITVMKLTLLLRFFAYIMYTLL